MKPIYDPNYLDPVVYGWDDAKSFFDHLKQLEWIEATPARKEYFMSEGGGIPYTYGFGEHARTYHSKPFTGPVEFIMTKLNHDFNCQYNVCFLNRYDNAKQALGYHADDSPGMNLEHPIAVISFGSPRSIYWKKKDFKGDLPPENKQVLIYNSLFTMPAGFQKDHFHKIAKSDQECGTRISLTFRNYRDPNGIYDCFG